VDPDRWSHRWRSSGPLPLAGDTGEFCDQAGGDYVIVNPHHLGNCVIADTYQSPITNSTAIGTTPFHRRKQPELQPRNLLQGSYASILAEHRYVAPRGATWRRS
jgi:hypothetical protein